MWNTWERLQVFIQSPQSHAMCTELDKGMKFNNNKPIMIAQRDGIVEKWKNELI